MLTCDEYDADGSLVLRHVEEVFARTAHRLTIISLRSSGGAVQTLQTTAEHPVQLGHARLETRQLVGQVRQVRGRGRRCRRPARTASHGPLFEGVPLGTLRALTLPFEGFGATVGADEDDCRFGHPRDLGLGARKA